MKIVHIVWSLTLGGIETMLVNIANAQANEGAEISVIIINDMYDESLINSFEDNINLIFLNRKQQSHNLTFIIRLNWILYKLNPDIIHLHSSRIYKIIYGKKIRKKIHQTLHDLPWGKLRGNGLCHRIFPVLSVSGEGNVRFIDRIPHVYAISNAVKYALWEKYHVVSTVVCNGIRTSDFIVRELSHYELPLRIVLVSRLQHEKKGHDLLIRALSQLKDKVEVNFIGEGQSFDFLKNLSEELGVERYVHFHGKQTQYYIAKNLCKYDLFVQPSRYEGFGLTVAEAMAAQVPVLVSAGQGPAEVTCGNKYGWVFENGDVEDLVCKIEYIREHYTEALDKAKEACNYVTTTYDVSVTARKYLREYGFYKN